MESRNDATNQPRVGLSLNGKHPKEYVSSTNPDVNRSRHRVLITVTYAHLIDDMVEIARATRSASLEDIASHTSSIGHDFEKRDSMSR